MVKIDAELLKYLEADDLRVLTAVEMGMKNHQLVPGALVNSIAGLRGGGTSKILQNLTRNGLLVYERGKKYDGYRLTFHGYDALGLNVLSRRGVITHIGNQIGVGKESDVYIAANEKGDRFAIKLHRLGRTCFRRVQDKRDYSSGKVHNWIYMSRLSAVREFSFLQALHERGFPVPKPFDINRHIIVMELIDGTLLNHVAEIEDKAALYDDLMNLILSLANDYGVVHGDFNEFNLMVHNETAKPILIDFPQMISTKHKLAKEYFTRDVNCIVNMFKRKYHFESEEIPDFEKDVKINETEEGIITALTTEANSFEPYLEDEDSNLNSIEAEKSEPVESFGLMRNNNDQNVTVITGERREKEMEDSSGRRVSENSDSDRVSIAESKATYSVAGSTFSTLEIKTRLQKEFSNRARRESLRNAAKGKKGEDSAVRRQRRENNLRIKDDKGCHNQEWFVN